MTWTFSCFSPKIPATLSFTPLHVLRGIVQDQAVPLPLGDRGVRLHRVMMMDRRGVDLVDPHGRLRQSTLDVTPALVARFSRVRVRVGTGESAQEVEPRPKPARNAAARRGCLPRLLQCFGNDDRDGLIVIEDLVVLEDRQPSLGLREPKHSGA